MMKHLNLSLSTTIPTVLIALCTVLFLTACGGGGGTGDTIADAASVDTDTTVDTGAWQAKLIKPTEKAKIIGEGNLVYQSERGMYLIVFVEVTNSSGTLQVVPRDLFKLSDGQGNEYKAVKSAIQVAYVQHKGKEQGLEIILDSPMQNDEVRAGVVVFEIPEEASGLMLSLKDSSETLNTGF
ncbi:MAG: DUF4352 domain-containing protein [Chloroflexota bacterium]